MNSFDDIDIALINPFNDKIVLRDFYSSTISKGIYNWPNIDLLSLAANLQKKFKVRIIDANTEKLTSDKVIKLLKSKKLKGLIFSVGKSVLEDDYQFINEIKIGLNQKVEIFVVGGVVYYNAKKELENNTFLDGCIINFTTDDISNYFLNKKTELKNLVYRENNKIIECENQLPSNGFKLPVAPHNQLNLKKYKLSHGKSNYLTSVITSYGCPHKCSFCVSGKINYRYRDPDNIIEELDYLKKIGVKEIMFKDNIFGFHKRNYKELLTKMINRNYNFSWVSDSRVDVLDEELLDLMYKSGCHALHFGIETKNEKTLENYQKNLKNINCVKTTLDLCKQYGILTVGYFILGLPGETKEDVIDTINYSVELNLNFASFNLPIPIIGTELRLKSIENNWVLNHSSNYDGSKTPIINTGKLLPEELKKLKNKAYKKFYLRPIFILKIIFRIKNFFQLKMIVLEFTNLITKRH
jgi:radical SAM superfamily enzyme YgiQ (UPF0313 family)